MATSIKLNGKLYEIARSSDGKLQYNHRSGLVERGEGLWEKTVFPDGSDGMGYSAEAPGVPEGGFYYSQNCLTVLPHALSPGPTVKTVVTALTKNVRSFFEEKEEEGEYYLYACGVGEVAKVKLTAIPEFVWMESAWTEEIEAFQADAFQADAFGATVSGRILSTDLFGQPVRIGKVELAFQADSFQEDAFATYSSGQWLLPPDDGDRIIGISRVAKAPSPDVWNVHTDVVDGASHFVIAARNIWRMIASGRGKKVSACDVLSDPTLDDSWGGKFPFGEQGAAATALVALHRFIFAITQANVFGVTEDFNAAGSGGAVSFSEMLPDTDFTDEEIDGAPVTGLGTGVWDASVIIPVPFALYRHDISSYDRIGPDAFPHNSGDEPNLTDQIRFGRHRGVAAAGQWLYQIYEMSDGDGFYILAGRTRKYGSVEPVILQPIVYRSTGRTLVLRVTRNGIGDPRLWWARRVGDVVTFEYIDLGLDGGPFRPDGSFGEAGASGAWFGKEFDLGAPGTPKSLREVETVLDSGDAELSWQNQVCLDGGAPENVGAALTAAGGTGFFAAQKKARRVRPVMVWTGSGSYVEEENHTKIRKVVYRGAWLPQVADTVTAFVDVLATAKRWGSSPADVRNTLSGLVLADNYSFKDIHGAASVQVVVNEASMREGVEVAGLEGKEIAQLSIQVQKLS